MMPVDRLRFLLTRLAEGEEMFLSAFDVTPWPEGTLERLVAAGLLREGPQAENVTCDGCEKYCLQPVHVRPGLDDRPPSILVICDQREDIGRVSIKPEQLRQWRCGLDLLAVTLARMLEIEETPERLSAGLWRLGRAELPGLGRECFLAAKDGFDSALVPRGGVVLLAAATGEHGIPLPSILRLDDGVLILDRLALGEWLSGWFQTGEAVHPPQPAPSFPGRPSLMAAVEQEMHRRASNGELLPSLQKEAAWLAEWTDINHPGQQTPTEKAIKNALRHVYRSLNNPA
ncbi:MAG: hypothetical protein HQL73_04150 [Magnetococcales bacterium]|nr:hypothetical protein [Magnetococcales bacterium]